MDVWTLVGIILLITLGQCVWPFLFASDRKLLPPLALESKLPPEPRRPTVPADRGTCIRAAKCRECSVELRVGDNVAFRRTRRGYPLKLQPYCLSCAERILRAQSQRIAAYEAWERLRDEQRERNREALAAHFRKYFGSSATPPVDPG